MQNPQNIEFVSILETTSSVETTLYISLDEVDIAMVVFQLHDKQEDLSRSSDSNNPRHSGYHEDTEGPQAKVTLLPSRDLHGLWKSCVVKFHET